MVRFAIQTEERVIQKTSPLRTNSATTLKTLNFGAQKSQKSYKCIKNIDVIDEFNILREKSSFCLDFRFDHSGQLLEGFEIFGQVFGHFFR